MDLSIENPSRIPCPKRGYVGVEFQSCKETRVP
jgi:hypothetical protein